MALNRFGQSEDFAEWSRKIHDIMDEMLKRSFVDFRDSGAWAPATNVYEYPDAYHICVELSGVQQDHLDVQCLNQRVALAGMRHSPRPQGQGDPVSIHALEINEGVFRREIELPGPVDVDAIEATYSKGYLWIRLPRTSPA